MCNGLKTLVINTYDIVSYVICGIPTLPCSVVDEGTPWKGYFSTLKESIHGMESQFCFLLSQNFLPMTQKVILR